jgi:hypothetical protein
MSTPRWWPKATGATSCAYGMTLADRLCTMTPRVMEVSTYCIHLGAALAMATTQLQLGEDLTMVELGFPGETSYR